MTYFIFSIVSVLVCVFAITHLIAFFGPVAGMLATTISVGIILILSPNIYWAIAAIGVTLTTSIICAAILNMDGISDLGERLSESNNERSFLLLQLTAAVIVALLVHSGGSVLFYAGILEESVSQVTAVAEPATPVALPRNERESATAMWCKYHPTDFRCPKTVPIKTQAKPATRQQMPENPWFPLGLSILTIACLLITVPYVVVSVREEVATATQRRVSGASETIDRLMERGASTVTETVSTGGGDNSGELRDEMHRRMNTNLLIDVFSNLFLHRWHAR
jgi:hypothetical protein